VIIVTLKYVLFTMRADNDGEGGIMALIALVTRLPMLKGRARWALIALGIFGASLFYGDGMITPAISVLSATEGLEIASPSLADYVVPIALVVLTALFVIQRFGTGAVGTLFGPVMCVWFATLAILGIGQIVDHPAVLRSLSPTYAVQFFADQPGTAFLAMGSVVLAVTGAEALYADMGHFGRAPIRRAWLVLVFPALLLNYMGQGALVIDDPAAVDNPFYRLAPDWFQYPLIVLATLATVIASQAVISGAFSVTRQAVQLGFLPRLLIRHTSEREIGQIYVPFVNWALYVAIVALVVGFGSSSNLASAYGIAVTGTLAIDTILAFVVVRLLWKKPLWMVLLGAAGFLVVDLAFLSANLTKIVHGGWFPLAVGAVTFTLLMTWRRGRTIVADRMRASEMPLEHLLHRVSSLARVRVPGTAVYLTATGDGAPLSLTHNLEHNHVLHEHVVLFTARTTGVPHVPPEERLTVRDLGHGVIRIYADYGFQDRPDVLTALRQANEENGLTLDVDDASFFLNHVTLLPSGSLEMRHWRKALFVVMQRNATSAARHFGLPSDRVVELGAHVRF
jgi:KUP system potassium uptake protein